MSSLSPVLAQSLPAACKGNNCTIACDGQTRIGKICKDGNNCGAPEIFTLAPSSAAASPQDNLDFTGIPAGGATITYTIRNPNTPVSTGGTQADPNSGSISNTTQNFSVAIDGSQTITYTGVTGPTYSQQISVDQIQGRYTLAQYEATCTPATSGNTTNIRIIKNSLGGTATFGYTTTNNLAAGDAFNLDTSPGGSAFVDFAVTGTGTKRFTIDEPSVPSGWDFDNLSCNFTQQSPGSSATVTGHSVDIQIKQGDQLVCTYTNSKKANVTLKKVTSDSSTGTFPFTSSISSFNNQPITTTGGMGTLGPATVTADASQTITEADPSAVGSGYSLTSASCELTGGGTPANPQSFDSNTRQLSFTPAAGEDLTCTFTNAPRTQTGTIKIQKRETNNSAVVNSPAFNVQLDNATVSPSGNAGQSGLKIGEDTDVITVAAGKHTISETSVPAGFTFSSIECGTFGGPTNSSSLEITVNAGESATCVVKNTQLPGSVTIQKLTIGGTGTFTFTGPKGGFSITTVAANTPTSNGSSTFTNLAPNTTYTVTETVDPGWTLQSIDGQGCNKVGNSVEVTPSAGGSIMCTFINFKKNDDPMDQVTQLFVHRRVDNLLTEGPDRSRMLRRLQQGPQPSLKDGPLKLSGGEAGGPFNDKVGDGARDSNGMIASYSATLPQEDGLPWVDAVMGRTEEENAYGLASGPPLGPTSASSSILSSIASQLTPLGAGQTSFKFGTSLSEMRAAAAEAEATAQRKKLAEAGLGFDNGPYINPALSLRQGLDVWIEGHISRYNDGLGGISREGDFRILYVGADYTLAPGILVGALVQIDDTKEDVVNPDLTGTVEGTGWMVGPYVGIRIADNLYFDARAAWGQSDNDIALWDPNAGDRSGSFDTTRWLATANLTGNQYFGALRLSPQAGFAYGNESYGAYTNSLGQEVPGNDISIGRFTVGGEIGYRFGMPGGTTVEPHVSITGIMNFATDDLVINGALVDTSESRGKVEGGVLVQTPDGWGIRAAGSYDGIGGNEFESYGGSLWVNVPIN